MQRKTDGERALCLSALTAALQAPPQPSPEAVGWSVVGYGIIWLALAAWQIRCRSAESSGALLRGAAAFLAGVQAAGLCVALPERFPQQPAVFGAAALVAAALWGTLLYPDGLGGAARILGALAVPGGAALVLSLGRVATVRSLLAAAGTAGQPLWPLPLLPELLLLAQQKQVPFPRVTGAVWGTWAVQTAVSLCAGAVLGNRLNSETTLQDVSRAGQLPLWGRGDSLTALLWILLVTMRVSALLAACCKKQKQWTKRALLLAGVGILWGAWQPKATLCGGQLLLWGLCLFGLGGGAGWHKKQKKPPIS